MPTCVKRWSNEEIEFLKRQASRLTIAEIAEALNRSPMSVKKFAGRLGISLATSPRSNGYFDSLNEAIIARKKAEAQYFPGVRFVAGEEVG